MTEPKLELDQIRTDYQKGALSESETGDDPIVFLEHWLDEAIHAQVMEVNAMVLSTLDEKNKLHSRVVLLKGLEDKSLQFFTNYNSAKGRQIAAHPEVAVVLFWKELQRQVRLEGIVEKLSEEASKKYFNSRPLGSRISAIASPQSQIIPNRNALEKKVSELESKNRDEIIKPENWGGFRIIPNYVEFWQGRHSRLHDRIVFRKTDFGHWEKYRLAP